MRLWSPLFLWHLYFLRQPLGWIGYSFGSRFFMTYLLQGGGWKRAPLCHKIFLGFYKPPCHYLAPPVVSTPYWWGAYWERLRVLATIMLCNTSQRATVMPQKTSHLLSVYMVAGWWGNSVFKRSYLIWDSLYTRDTVTLSLGRNPFPPSTNYLNLVYQQNYLKIKFIHSYVTSSLFHPR